MDATQRLAQAASHLQEDRLVEAEAVLQDVLQRWPGLPDGVHFLAVLRYCQGRNDEAIALFGQVLEQLPQHGGAWNNFGNVLIALERYDDAAKAYEHAIRAVGATPEATLTLNNLGILHRLHGRLGEAETSFRRALEIDARNATAWYNLSRVLIDQGHVHDGLIANSRAISILPSHMQARDLVIRALVLLDERERAAQLYREWLAEEPDNPVVLHQLAACLGDSPPERASDAYVEQVFDSFARSFDAKLEKLHYRAPQLVTEALRAAAGAPGAALDVVDVGCGTGLCGPLLRPWARSLAGCDLSVGMLTQAKSRGVYDKLHKAELVYYLDTQPGRFDAVVSADTLCYFGTLRAPIAAAARCLRPGGWLIFTVEALPEASESDHQLQTNGRYAHGAAYLRSIVSDAELTLFELRAETLRMEGGLPVRGWLVTARRAGQPGPGPTVSDPP